MSIRIIMTTEPVMVDGVVTTYHRAQIWEGSKHPHVKDTTGLYDTEAAAREAGEELLCLYDTQENFATVLLGYCTVDIFREQYSLATIIVKNRTWNYTVPVYTKVNDRGI